MASTAVQQLPVEEILTRTAVAARLTPQQHDLVWEGINRMALAYITYRETGSLTYSYPFRVHPLAIRFKPGEDPGTFDIVLMQVIMDLWAKLQKSRRKRMRLTLNLIELFACVLAVRVGRDYERILLRKKHTRMENRNANAVIDSLERQLKTARRRYAAEAGEPAYKAMRARWFAHLRWVRMHLVYFRPVRVKTQLRRVQKLLIDECCEWARAGLINKKYEPPPAKELRRLVRLALRYVRRRRPRLRFPIRNLIDNPRFAQSVLANFVLDRLDLNPIQQKTKTKEIA
jgi:hypothetical protein